MSATPARPAAVLWDMDGTLLDTEPLWDNALYAEANRLGGTLTPTGRAELVGASMDDTARYLLNLAGLNHTPEYIDGINRRIRHQVRQKFQKPLPWRPGARDALNSVRNARIPCALVTSTERVLVAPALHTLGSFDAVVCGDEVDGFTKPHPGPYLRAARLLGVNPADCLAVEDSATGSAAAVAAGCTVLVVPSDASVPAWPGLTVIRSLAGLDASALFGLWRQHYRKPAESPTPVFDTLVQTYIQQGMPCPVHWLPPQPAPRPSDALPPLPRRNRGASLPPEARRRPASTSPDNRFAWFASATSKVPA